MTHLPEYLTQDQGVIPCLKLLPELERCNQVYCDDTRGRTFLRGVHSRVEDRHPNLLDWQTGDSPHRDLGRAPQEKGQAYIFVKGLFDWANPPPNSWGDALAENSLMSEVILQTIIFCLRVLERHPSQNLYQVHPPLYLFVQP